MGLSTSLMLKGFKGKGDAQVWLGDAQRDYDDVVGLMMKLSELSRSMVGHQFYLQVHRRKAVNIELDVALRWRGANSVSNKHVSWVEVLKHIGTLNQEVRDNYFMMQSAALYFNLRLRAIRHEVKMAHEAQSKLMSTDLIGE